MKIALGQTEIVWKEKDKNISSASQLLADAKEQGAKLLLFPEMSFTGFSMNIGVTGETQYETFEKVKELAVKHQIAVGFGWVMLRDGRGENHYTVVDETGVWLADYVKLHPFSYSGEDKFFNPGDKLASFAYCGMKIGIQICYDLRFPEPFLALAETCDLIIVPANWPAKRSEHWKCLLKARAIENQVYIAGINCVGSQKGTVYSGDSAVFSPIGKQLNETINKPGLIYCDIQADSSSFRQDFPTRQDRRWDLYQRIYQQR